MTDRIKYQEVAWAERKVDCYAGPTFDVHSPTWESHFEGDMEANEDGDDLVLDPKQFPAGTKVLILVPVCPDCGNHVELCEIDKSCGFDWKAWAEEKYA